MARVLVTGGAGYIGSHVVLDLLARGHQVRVLDNLSTGRATAVPPGLLIQGDVGDLPLLTRVLREQRYDAAIHLAALSLIGKSVQYPLHYYQHNVARGIQLVQALSDHGARAVVFSSTAAVYGEPEVVPIPETHPLRPVSPYGETKFVMERVLAAARQERGLAYACLRYFNAAGADPAGRAGEDHEPETHLIPLAIQAATGGGTITVNGTDYPTPDGTCIRDFIHVSDLAAAHGVALERLLECPDVSGAYNLGTGKGHSVRDVLQAVAQVIERPVPAVAGPRRPGDPAVLVAAAGRFAATFGWVPRYPDLPDLVRTAAAWHERKRR